MRCLYPFVAATCLGLLLIAGLSGCIASFGDEVYLSVTMHEYGLTTIDSAMVEAYGYRETYKAWFGNPVSSPGSGTKAPTTGLAKDDVNRILLDGEPMERSDGGRFVTRFDSAFQRDHEYLLEFDLFDDEGDVERKLKFTIRKDYMLHGLPDGDSLARGDTLRLWWNPEDTGWDSPFLLISVPPYDNHHDLYRHTGKDSSRVTIPGFPADADSVRVEFRRNSNEWYTSSDNRDVYYQLDGMNEYILTGNP